MTPGELRTAAARNALSTRTRSIEILALAKTRLEHARLHIADSRRLIENCGARGLWPPPLLPERDYSRIEYRVAEIVDSSTALISMSDGIIRAGRMLLTSARERAARVPGQHLVSDGTNESRAAGDSSG